MRATPALCSVCLLAASCSDWQVGQPRSAPDIRLPAVWREASSPANHRIATGWLDSFGNPAMRKVVNEALANNQDLQAAAARLREAKEGTIAGQARLLPSLDSSASAIRTRNENGRNRATEAASYDLTLAARWEPDLWGRLRDLKRASWADHDAALADYRGACLSLAANAAKAWCNVITANQQLELAQVTLASFEKNLRIIERNYKAGVPNVRSLDVNFGRTNVSAAQRAVRQRELERDDAARALEVLMGRYPAAALATGSDLPGLATSVPAGIPADTIERRPDLAAARARILAAAQRASSARKNLLPNLRLTAASGIPTASFARLLDSDFLVSSVAASLQQILFDGGTTAAEARALLARNDALIRSYCQDSLEALREVESALAADRSLAAQENFLVKEVEQAALAERQSERDYSEGIEGSDILAVLEAQRRANNARSNLIRLRNDRLQNRIDLHLALGGEF